MTMYYLAIVLPQDLDKKILAFKHYMLETYGCKVGLKSPAHITIVAPFWMPEELEKDLIQDTDVLAAGIQNFNISTAHFSSFKPRTIFIDVAKNEQLNDVKKAADAFFKTRPQYKIKIDERAFHPHITIATRDLQKHAYFEAWPYFQQKDFAAIFAAGGISVLRHNKKNWDVIHTSQFQNM